MARKDEPSYMGTFSSARRHVTHSFATTQSAMMKKRAARYMISSACPLCEGTRLRKESLSVTFEGLDYAEISRLPMARFSDIFAPYADADAGKLTTMRKEHPEKAMVVQRIAADLCRRMDVLLDLGLGHLTLERSTPTLSPGELQRLRLATQVVSNLFGVVYVMDEPSAGLHPADTEALLRALDGLKAVGNSLFVVEHELDVVRHADWIVDVDRQPGSWVGRSSIAAHRKACGRSSNPKLPGTCLQKLKSPAGPIENQMDGFVCPVSPETISVTSIAPSRSGS